jgi:nucleoside-diphosphate-sugar epimerase
VLRAAIVERDRFQSGELFYVSGDGISTYRNLLSVIARVMKKKPHQITVPFWALTGAAGFLEVLHRITGKSFPLTRDKLSEIAPDYWICSNRKAKNILDFKPQFDLESGMTDAIQWYKKNNWL